MILIPSVACAADLLDAMEKSPHHFNGLPSDDLLTLISAIETANPNATDISEDETNASWGHRQLSGAWRNALIKWESVGTCNVACQLIAAAVRTCKVGASGYLCDAYLEQMIEKLWECWKEAGGVSNLN